MYILTEHSSRTPTHFLVVLMFCVHQWQTTLSCLSHPLIPALDSHAEAAGLLGNFQIRTPVRFRNTLQLLRPGKHSGKAEMDKFSWRPWGMLKIITQAGSSHTKTLFFFCLSLTKASPFFLSLRNRSIPQRTSFPHYTTNTGCSRSASKQLSNLQQTKAHFLLKPSANSSRRVTDKERMWLKNGRDAVWIRKCAVHQIQVYEEFVE